MEKEATPEPKLEESVVCAVAKFTDLYNATFSVGFKPPRVIMGTREYMAESLAKVNGAKVFGTCTEVGGGYDPQLDALVFNPSSLVNTMTINLVSGHELGHFIQYHTNPFFERMERFWAAPADVSAFEWVKTVPNLPEPPYFKDGNCYNNAAAFLFLVYEEGGAQWAHDRILGFGTTHVNKDYDFSARVWATVDSMLGRERTKDLFLQGSPNDFGLAVKDVFLEGPITDRACGMRSKTTRNNMEGLT